ncbi:erythrocyte vesicle protein 1 [Plasmodium falciparum NF54]|uniref:Erythrocyte vesicle protein 1 n=2 Tax=Plasmodium falciparum TaxID=5833 RepID=Q9U0I6_PLAF7|nr:erythrocyte vesicle protein 1 [Plasmodium falciparum 3D7]KAF4329951.1 erythrocyte vesicle protein 1 [Plasmodium falciparum NF54]PKC48764.1 erythrocyte vesicle protein 1 [Plasmodium falciparum NF54]CAB62877.2 erythrocyte vesicle protein 1 [Plasmodium falciparum 3D7]|eukprot:XP_001351415.1 erythrocyte vesicle protein 1 [Plasmodium falciparum 3D7]
MYKKCFILYPIFFPSLYIYIIKNDHLNSEQSSFSRIIAEYCDTKKNEFFLGESILGATSSRSTSLNIEQNKNTNIIKDKNEQSYDEHIVMNPNTNRALSINTVFNYNKENKEKKIFSFSEFPKEFNILDVVWPYMKQPKELFKKSSVITFLMDHYFRHELYILESRIAMKPRRRTYEAPCFEHDDFELERDFFFLEDCDEDHQFFNKYKSYFFSLNVLDHCKSLRTKKQKCNNMKDDEVSNINDDEVSNINDDEVSNINDDEVSNIKDDVVRNINDDVVRNINDDEVHHTNDDKVNHTNDDKVNHTNDDKVNHTNDDKVNHTNDDKVNHTNDDNVNHTNDDKVNHTNDDKVNHTNDDKVNHTNDDKVNHTNNYYNDKKNNAGDIKTNNSIREEKKLEHPDRNIEKKIDLITYNKKRIEEYYDSIISYFFGLIILYHNKKETNLNYYTKFLTLDKYKNMYNCLNNDISKIYEKAILFSHEEFCIIQKKDLKPHGLRGNIKYYYFFNRIVSTSLYLLHEILQKLDGKMYTFQKLPLKIQNHLINLPDIRIKEIKKRMRQQKKKNQNSLLESSSYKDLYYVSSEYYDYVSKCLIWSNYYFFNYMSTTIVYSVKKRSYEYIQKEKSKINLFLEYAHNDIIEYIKDITYYFKLIVNKIESKRLFSEPVMLCFQLFSDHYLYLLKNILSILLIHIEKPVTRKSNRDLKKIFNCIKDQENITKNILDEFHSKNKIRYNPTEFLIYKFFSSIQYKQNIAHKYIIQSNINIISLMLKIFNYFHILVISLIFYLNLHSMYTLFIDLDIDDTLKFQHDQEFLNYFKRYQDFNNQLFDSFRSDDR